MPSSMMRTCPSFVNADSRHFKYAGMTAGLPRPKTTTFKQFVTESESTYGQGKSKEEYRKTLELNNSFENTATKLIKARLAQSEAHYVNLQRFSDAEYPNFTETERHLACYTADDFEPVFMAHATRDAKISLDEIPLVVKETMREDGAEWIIKKFVVLARRKSLFKQITWEDFRLIVPAALESSLGECKLQRVQEPEWLTLRRPTTSAGMILNNVPNSTYRIDYSAERLDNPLAPPTTRFTFAGTTKATHHLPKYCGHIPANTSNLLKAKHSCGDEPRPHLSNLRLTTARMGSVPGYTGYIPYHTGLSQDRTTGCDPNTTTGAAYSGNGISLL